MNPISTGLNVFSWLFIRLPLGFSIPFSAASLWWIFGGFRWVNDRLATPLVAGAMRMLLRQLPQSIGSDLIGDIAPFLQAGVVIVLFALGFIVAYNGSALVNWLLVISRIKPAPYACGPPQLPSESGELPNPFINVNRIGIVLAGGGAKGAYQAGAMKAIYRFLAQHKALPKVKVLASTSIGSWNALFWLANLIKPPVNWEGRSIHEQWWRAISAKSLAAPSWYVPLLRNAFLSSRPWQQSFDRVFGREDVKHELLNTPVHFYFTRSNVFSAQLECATNNPRPPPIPHVSYDTLNPADPVSYLDGLKVGVFASMDLPPLFPFTKRGRGLFEDGGVIDNLPITFAAVDDCDLIFILPLNSDFERRPNTHSLLARLLRVMDVRQGALERSGFKMLYLYNELAALRGQVHAAANGTPSTPSAQSGPLNSALRRHNELINVFAVCPQKSFVEEVINTTDLWKRKGAAEAFETMHAVTAKELPGFPFQGQEAVRVALVSRGGNVTWDENF